MLSWKYVSENRNDLRSVNPKYDQLGAFNPLRVYRVFRAFIEIALIRRAIPH
jgi:hypothetical protein